MARIPVDEVPAGPVMDAAVAEALGWKNLHWKEVDRGSNHYAPAGWWGDGPNGECYLNKSYSTDIAATWELAPGILNGNHLTFVGNHWSVWHFDEYDNMPNDDAIAETAALAICRAFLKTNGIEFVEVSEWRNRVSIRQAAPNARR
jgi:hypothetical protein